MRMGPRMGGAGKGQGCGSEGQGHRAWLVTGQGYGARDGHRDVERGHEPRHGVGDVLQGWGTHGGAVGRGQGREPEPNNLTQPLRAPAPR